MHILNVILVLFKFKWLIKSAPCKKKHFIPQIIIVKKISVKKVKSSQSIIGGFKKKINVFYKNKFWGMVFLVFS